MHGQHPCWPSDWSVGKKIELLQCAFTRTSLDNNSQNISIDMELEALDENDAINLAKDIIIREFDLFTLCVDNPTYLDQNYASVDRE
jgi:hypothetical protein